VDRIAMTLEIRFIEVLHVSEAQTLRDIRNECKDYMTRNTEYITEDQQVDWFNSLDRDSMKIYLIYMYNEEVMVDVVGFGYCKRDENETYLTGGIKENHRGKGYGKLLFSYLLEQAKSFNTPITLEVLNTNTRAKNLYESLGFVEIKKDDRIMKMEYR
jgi:ribosomal protein S18 acetylase RimI-like enzyme